MSSGDDTPKGIDRATVKRVWAFSLPYRARVIIFLTLTIIGTGVGIIPSIVLSLIHISEPTRPY